MSNLTIPEALAKHPQVGSAAKLLWAELMARAKKGEPVETNLGDFGLGLALGGDDTIAALTKLEDYGFAQRIEESGGKLTELVDGQKVKLSLLLTVETLPILPLDEQSVAQRRYGASDDDPHYDKVKIGMRVFTGKVSKFMEEWWLSIDVKEGREDRTVVSNMSLPTLQDAWKWFDDFLESPDLDAQIAAAMEVSKLAEAADSKGIDEQLEDEAEEDVE